MVITARYPGTCRRCGGAVKVGAQIEWSRDGGSLHVACPAKVLGNADQPQVRRNAKADYCGECRVSIPAGAGHLWKCIPDGGCMEHFDTDDGGWHVSCIDTTACKARIAEQKAARATAQAEARRIDTEFRAIEETIRQGERPGSFEAPVTPEGERYCDSGNIYGGGSSFVVGPEHIWYIQRNGADGDDWGRNNVPGSIGWRIPFDAALAERIRALDSAKAWSR